MSKAVMISIRPRWCELIANGEKTIEVRKTRPKLETPFKCYIYCTAERAGYDALWVLDAPTRKKYSFVAVSAYLEHPKGASKGNEKVIGEFTCERIVPITYDGGRLWCPTNAAFSPATCLSQAEIIAYIGDKGCCYVWHISDLKIYDEPRKVSEFTGLRDTRFGAEPVVIKHPPQSWFYVEELRT